MKKVSTFDWVALALLVAGGINTGLFGLFNIDVIHRVLQNFPVFERLAYAAIGASAIYIIVRMARSRENQM
jgi:uncharacterized membrane protein YuzA (DUF378 family)